MSALRSPLEWWHNLSPWLDKQRNGQTPVVLVVDDNIAPLITLVQLLNRQGIAARGAGGAREAWDRLCGYDECFSAFVASTSVARADDGWLVRHCRSAFPDLPVIVVAESPAADFEYRTSCFAYLARPFRRKQLLDVVTLALNPIIKDASRVPARATESIAERRTA